MSALNLLSLLAQQQTQINQNSLEGGAQPTAANPADLLNLLPMLYGGYNQNNNANMMPQLAQLFGIPSPPPNYYNTPYANRNYQRPTVNIINNFRLDELLQQAAKGCTPANFNSWASNLLQTPNAPYMPSFENPAQPYYPTQPTNPTYPTEPQPTKVALFSQIVSRNNAKLKTLLPMNYSNTTQDRKNALQGAKEFFGTNWNTALNVGRTSKSTQLVFMDQSGATIKTLNWQDVLPSLTINGVSWPTAKQTWLDSNTPGAKKYKAGKHKNNDYYAWQAFATEVFGSKLGSATPQIIYHDSYGQQYEIDANLNVSPIALDMSGKGKVDLTSVKDGVKFDIDGDGKQEQVAWTKAQGEQTSGWLALPDPVGQITSGKQLFGNQWGDANGYERLKQFDSNHDNVIDSKDTVYSQLKIWQDKDHDGKVDAGEMKGLKEAGVENVNISYTNSTEKDQFGNELRQQSSFTRTNESAEALAKQLGIDPALLKNGFTVDAWLRIQG